MKKTLFAIKIENVVDVTTNSSSELFVLEGQTKEIVEEMISNVYPNYLSEYEPLQDIREMSDEEIQSYLDWHLYSWNGKYEVLKGFTFEEMYELELDKDGNKTTDYNGRTNYKLINNNPDPKRPWDTQFVYEENRQRVINAIESEVGRFFLYSIDENPNWECQESLEMIATRYHLG